MIAGFAPKFTWRQNADGATRTLAEAVNLARRWGVTVPDYVHFAFDRCGVLKDNVFAGTTKFEEPVGTRIYWRWLFHKLTGEIPFLIRAELMSRDEAIVAVIGHEMFELENLRPSLEEGIAIEDFAAATSADNPGNIHYRAWDYADELVAKMRENQA